MLVIRRPLEPANLREERRGEREFEENIVIFPSEKMTVSLYYHFIQISIEHTYVKRGLFQTNRSRSIRITKRYATYYKRRMFDLFLV